MWAALAGLLGQDADDLAGAPRLPALGAPVMYRVADFESILDDGVKLLRSTADADEGKVDEVDRLFGVTQ